MVAQISSVPDVEKASVTAYKLTRFGIAKYTYPAGSVAQWCIDGVCGVAGFSGVEGFAAKNKYYTKRMTSAQKNDGCRLEYGRKGRPCQLPYLVGPGEERLLSRFNMVEQKSSVSKKQCVVKCAADGTGILAADLQADSPTLWRAAGGPWNTLYQGQEQILSEGDQISLDCEDPERAVFVCNFGEGGAGEEHYHQQQQGGPTAGWEAQVDQASGMTYYVNSQTGESQWELPPS